MKPVARPILMLHPDRALRERVAAASGGEYLLKPVRDWDALEEEISSAPPSAMVMVDPVAAPTEDAGGSRLSPRLRHILHAYRSMSVIALMKPDPAALRELDRWGVVQVIMLGHDDTVPAIASRLRAARGRPLRAMIEQILPPETSGRARAVIDAAADVVATGRQGSHLAREMNLSRRTLLRWSENAGLPPPRRLLAWMRILLACALLDDRGRAVGSVARAAGYSSDSGLRRVTQTFLKASPTELRERGAFDFAAKGFVQTLREYRLMKRAVTRES